MEREFDTKDWNGEKLDRWVGRVVCDTCGIDKCREGFDTEAAARAWAQRIFDQHNVVHVSIYNA